MITSTEKTPEIINTGGAAFPEAYLGEYLHKPELRHHPGMTLRDYFAAKAMQGIFAGQHPITKECDCEDLVVKAAYVIADAMIKARGHE